MGELSPDNKQLTFTAFDPVQGRGHEVARVSTDGAAVNWDLSPDGSRIALAKFGESRIRILPVAGGEPRDIAVKAWRCSGNGFDWSADGKGFYVSRYSPRSATLLYVDLEGRATALWEQRGSGVTWGVPSPDGRHLAILGMAGDINVCMIENF